jgi:hypothetical protein
MPADHGLRAHAASPGPAVPSRANLCGWCVPSAVGVKRSSRRSPYHRRPRGGAICSDCVRLRANPRSEGPHPEHHRRLVDHHLRRHIGLSDRERPPPLTPKDAVLAGDPVRTCHRPDWRALGRDHLQVSAVAVVVCGPGSVVQGRCRSVLRHAGLPAPRDQVSPTGSKGPIRAAHRTGRAPRLRQVTQICRSRAGSFCIGDPAGGVRSQRALRARRRISGHRPEGRACRRGLR